MKKNLAKPLWKHSWLMLSLVMTGPIALAGNVDKTYTHTDPSQQLPSKNIGNEIFYQIFVDRFFDGNRANNCLNEGRFCDPSKSDWYRYWGGDLRGIVDKLDYLKTLGVTRLWLTPIFENQQIAINRERHDRSIVMTSYHGYWLRDWFRLNGTFTDRGTEDYALLGELVDRAEPDLRILLDSVTNHASPVDPRAESISYLNRVDPIPPAADGTPRSHRGAVFKRGAYVVGVDEDAARFRANRNFEPAFHQSGWITDWNNWDQLQNFQLDGLADFDQTNGTVRDYMREAHEFWLTRFPGLAGYRMDTIKHVSMNYWHDFDHDLYAKFPAAEVIGEYYGDWQHDVRAQEFFRETRMTMFDFAFRHAAEDIFLRNGPLSQLSNLFARDSELVDARSLVTFLDNHDMSRLRGQGVSAKRMRQAIALWFAIRGIPCVYYGMEQDLFYPGDPGDPYNRPMMASFSQTSSFYQLIKSLTALRRENDALRYGSTHVVFEDRDVYAFERKFGGKGVVFAMSKETADKTVRVTGLSLPNGTYQDVLTGKTFQVNRGAVTLGLRDGDVVLLSTTRLRRSN